MVHYQSEVQEVAMTSRCRLYSFFAYTRMGTDWQQVRQQIWTLPEGSGNPNESIKDVCCLNNFARNPHNDENIARQIFGASVREDQPVTGRTETCFKGESKTHDADSVPDIYLAMEKSSRNRW